MAALQNQQWEEAARIYALEGTSKIEAYRRAYPKSANIKKDCQYVRASQVFARPQIKKRIEEFNAIRTEMADREFEVDARYILRRLVEIDKMDVLDILEDNGSVKPIRLWPPVWRQFIQQFDVEELFAGKGDERLNVGLLKKIKWPDKTKNLKLLGSHVSVNAFKTITEHQGANGGPIRMVTTDMTAQEAAEAYADTLNDE